MAEAAQSGAKTDEVECLAANEIRLTPGEIILRMVKSASRVKSAKPVADEIPAEFLNDLIFYNRKSGNSKSLPLRGEGG